jgi:hypothetical protein
LMPSWVLNYHPWIPPLTEPTPNRSPFACHFQTLPPRSVTRLDTRSQLKTTLPFLCAPRAATVQSSPMSQRKMRPVPGKRTRHRNLHHPRLLPAPPSSIGRPDVQNRSGHCDPRVHFYMFQNRPMRHILQPSLPLRWYCHSLQHLNPRNEVKHPFRRRRGRWTSHGRMTLTIATNMPQSPLPTSTGNDPPQSELGPVNSWRT